MTPSLTGGTARNWRGPNRIRPPAPVANCWSRLKSRCSLSLPPLEARRRAKPAPTHDDRSGSPRSLRRSADARVRDHDARISATMRRGPAPARCARRAAPIRLSRRRRDARWPRVFGCLPNEFRTREAANGGARRNRRPGRVSSPRTPIGAKTSVNLTLALSIDATGRRAPRGPAKA